MALIFCGSLRLSLSCVGLLFSMRLFCLWNFRNSMRCCLDYCFLSFPVFCWLWSSVVWSWLCFVNVFRYLGGCFLLLCFSNGFLLLFLCCCFWRVRVFVVCCGFCLVRFPVDFCALVLAAAFVGVVFSVCVSMSWNWLCFVCFLLVCAPLCCFCCLCSLLWFCLGCAFVLLCLGGGFLILL